MLKYVDEKVTVIFCHLDSNAQHMDVCDSNITHETMRCNLFRKSWWRHQMTLLALCTGNSPVTVECLQQRDSNANFDIQMTVFKYLVASHVTEPGSLLTEPGAVIMLSHFSSPPGTCMLYCFFDVDPHKLLNKQSHDRWFQTTRR